MNKFLIRMNVLYYAQDEEYAGKTYVSGFDYMGIITPKEAEFETKRGLAEELIQNILEEAGHRVERQELLQKIEEAHILGRRTAQKVLDQLESDKIIKKEKEGRKAYYTLCESKEIFSI